MKSESNSIWDYAVNQFQKKPKPGTLIIIRHGESEWNQKRLFTGWCDTDLTEKGVKEMEHASRLLLERGYTFDVVYTSMLKVQYVLLMMKHYIDICDDGDNVIVDYYDDDDDKIING